MDKTFFAVRHSGTGKPASDLVVGIEEAKEQIGLEGKADLAGATFTGRVAMAGNVANPAGAGITGGTGTVFKSSVTKEGDLFITRIFIDLTGLSSGGTAADIIGKNATAGCHLGRITAAVNGTIVGATMQCLETPAGGEDDIDLYAADEATGTEDAAVTALTNFVQVINGGAQTAGTLSGSVAAPAVNQYLYLAAGDATDHAYTAGQLLITLIGV